MEYAPVCAEVQVQCIKAPCHSIQQTFGNKCMMEANSLATLWIIFSFSIKKAQLLLIELNRR
jgi:hypothetical protein